MLKSLLRSLNGRRIHGSLRVVGFVLVINAALTAVGVASARVQAEKAAKTAGLELLRQIGPMLVGPPQAVILNGQCAFAGSKVTQLEVRDVLSRFEQHCQDQSRRVSDDFSALPTTPSAPVSAALDKAERWLTSRVESDDGEVGHLACFAGKSGGGVRGLLSRLRAFMASGDLSQVGAMRYVVARRDKQAGTTHVLTMWTEGTFNVREMFPKNSDVPGGDSENAPRPPDSIRILSSRLGDLPYAMRVYSSAQNRGAVLQGYVKEMTARGFAALSLPTSKDAYDLNQNAKAFAKDTGAVIVVATDGPEAKTVVSLLEMGGSGFVHAHAKESP